MCIALSYFSVPPDSVLHYSELYCLHDESHYCDFLRWGHYVLLGLMLVMIVLFSNFYIHAYVMDKRLASTKLERHDTKTQLNGDSLHINGVIDGHITRHRNGNKADWYTHRHATDFLLLSEDVSEVQTMLYCWYWYFNMPSTIICRLPFWHYWWFFYKKNITLARLPILGLFLICDSKSNQTQVQHVSSYGSDNISTTVTPQ